MHQSFLPIILGLAHLSTTIGVKPSADREDLGDCWPNPRLIEGSCADEAGYFGHDNPPGSFSGDADGGVTMYTGEPSKNGGCWNISERGKGFVNMTSVHPQFICTLSREPECGGEEKWEINGTLNNEEQSDFGQHFKEWDGVIKSYRCRKE